MKLHASAPMHAPYRGGRPAAPRQTWVRRGGRDLGRMAAKESQAVRGLIVGLPLALALWLMLALFVWAIF